MNENAFTIDELREGNEEVYGEMPDWKIRRIIISLQHMAEVRAHGSLGVYREVKPLAVNNS